MKIHALLLTSFVGFSSSLAFSQGVIKIGEVNSYKAQPAFLEPYKKGMELAVEEINAAGGNSSRATITRHLVTLCVPQKNCSLEKKSTCCLALFYRILV